VPSLCSAHALSTLLLRANSITHLALQLADKADDDYFVLWRHILAGSPKDVMLSSGYNDK
jgi:hypothetical protein